MDPPFRATGPKSGKEYVILQGDALDIDVDEEDAAWLLNLRWIEPRCCRDNVLVPMLQLVD